VNYCDGTTLYEQESEVVETKLGKYREQAQQGIIIIVPAYVLGLDGNSLGVDSSEVG
jgi:hypothetical protein